MSMRACSLAEMRVSRGVAMSYIYIYMFCATSAGTKQLMYCRSLRLIYICLKGSWVTSRGLCGLSEIGIRYTNHLSD